ncbi:MAG TPA: Type 1 glutamine amidotransferase-like domain-containing protein [Mucilaginibacter sp.]|jgi:dipeptidase E|nr:Type 1 glutamine amidotransferase-like domain-containing protein [Mucilaginibacter sp.]
MKYYLSSYKFGNTVEYLKTMLQPGSKIGHINNSRDFSWANPKIREKYQNDEIAQLNNFGFTAEPLDLKEYFGKEDLLRKKLEELGGLWVSGGNTFVLRQAMKLSGFDNLFDELRKRRGFLYAGYSAGICILCDSLKYIQIADDPRDFPYHENKETIWDGLGVFNYGLLPHYDSDHFESEAIGKDLKVCIDNKWLFKALRDGEVIIIEEE